MSMLASSGKLLVRTSQSYGQQRLAQTPNKRVKRTEGGPGGPWFRIRQACRTALRHLPSSR
jgi:hypothetical protein